MINKKIITTVIPTFNREKYLEKAIKSCLDQTIEHEIIVCNHGGTDGTDDMIKQFGKKIYYIKKPKDFGPHFCWLDGVMHAKGDYINILFDDDWIEKNYIEECIKYFDDENVGFVFTPAKIFDDESEKVENILHDEYIFENGIYKIDKYELDLLYRLISPTSLIFRKKDILDSLFNKHLPLAKYSYKGVGPDRFMMLLCMLRYSKFGFIKTPLVYYRKHKASITVDSSLDHKKKQLIKKAYDEVDKYYYTLRYGKFFSFLQNILVFRLRFFIYKPILSLKKLYKKLFR